MKRSILILLSLGVVAIAPLRAANASEKPQRPNIVILVADDMGFADTGVYGCKDIPTPNIDSLAKNGTRFLNGYSSGCVCSPARAGLITGRYQQRFGFDANAEGKLAGDRGLRALDIQQTTFAQYFKKLGYATGLFGKWHLGAEPGYLPTQRGFDEFYGFLPYGIAAQGPEGPPIYRGTNIVDRPTNHMEQFSTEALSFIDRHQKEPFFLYLPFSAVHGPFVGPQPYLSRFDDDMMPASRRKYSADLSQMDDIIGRVLKRLRDRGLEENTLIFFFSDNGGPGGASRNTPLRGTKWTLWEGGIHVPYIVQWKGRIPAGRELSQPVIQVDLLPTSLAAAGGEIKPEWKLDGANLLPLLEAKSLAAPHDALYWRFGVQYAVRLGDWKLVKPSIDSQPFLFDLSKDIGETNNLAAQEPEKAKELQALWDKWNAKNEAPRWIDNRWNGDGPRSKEKSVKNTPEISNASTNGPWKTGSVLSADAAPQIAGHALLISAEIEPTGTNGVIISQGAQNNGYVLYLSAGKLIFDVRNNRQLTTVTAGEALGAGHFKVEASLGPDGAILIAVNGKQVATGHAPGVIAKQPARGLSVGVGDAEAANPFSGKIENAKVQIL